MMTIKIQTWSLSGVELITLIETSEYPVEIQRWHYNTFEEYRTLMREKFHKEECSFTTHGEWPEDNKLAYDREFAYVTYFNPDGDFYSFVLNYGYLYVMQEGKTIDKLYIRPQNDKPTKEEQPIN